MIERAEPIILVVDDNPINLGVVADYLEAFDLEIITARSGAEGIHKTQYAMPDLILLDVMMPEMNGFEVCQHLQNDPKLKRIPVIFMTALTSEDDKVRGFESGAVDYITKPIQQRELWARVTTHLRLRAQARQLEQLNATKDKFFSIVAHDLKNPFQPLLGNLELLAISSDRMSLDDIQQMSQGSYQAAKHIYDLLENLLQWSRLQMERVRYQPQTIDLQRTVARNMGLLHQTAAHKKINLLSRISANTMVQADAHILDTIIRNLMNNALKFTPQGGEVTVSARDAGKYAEVCISDTGVGMPPETKEAIFRIDKNATRKGTAGEQGTGLGLIICQEMVKQQGGKIWIESEVDQGTKVYFTVSKS